MVDVQIEERHGPVVFFFVREFYVSSVVHSVDIVCVRLLFFFQDVVHVSFPQCGFTVCGCCVDGF